MIICENCFVDPEIKAKIRANKTVGSCPICKSKHVHLYNTDTNHSLDGVFDNLLSAYTAEDDLPGYIPRNELNNISAIVKNDWNLFSSISEERIHDILIALSPEIFEDYPNLFSSPVGIAEKYERDFLEKNSIIKKGGWDDFVESIKYRNRFHTNILNLDILKEYCKLIAEDIPTSSLRYYRGRIAKSPCGFTPSEMGAPPKDKSTEGRANSAGISRLYLTSNRETVFHEIRAAEYDYVTIGTFKQLVPLRVVNLSRIAKISPFAEDIDCTILAINKEHLSRINEELSRTMRRNDSLLDYLATQYISDFVMSIEDEKGNCLFDGVVYKSAMTNSGFNLAVFDPSKFKCTYCQTYEVSKLTYEKRISTI